VAPLRRVSDASPGISRQRAGSGFRFRLSTGAPVRDRATIARIRALAIPPAWTDVWIAADPKAHIQATGRDARGRKQYRYHVEWHAAQDHSKYLRLGAFGAALPSIRSRVRRDLRRADASREQVLALLVMLLESTYIRVGNREYARTNRSYGLTTLEDRHVTVEGDRVHFAFRGKAGIRREVTLEDRTLARLVRQCRDIPGKHLFQYVDESGARRAVHAGELNAYIADMVGGGFTAKDFRTWGGTLLAAEFLERHDAEGDRPPGRKWMVRDVCSVSERLGNTPAVCRKSYVHPYLLAAYTDERAWTAWRRTRSGRSRRGLSASESRLLRYLETAERRRRAA